MEEDRIINLQTECYEGSRVHKFDINFYLFPDGGRLVAYCPALDITTTGKDFNDAITQFHECFQLYVETCLEMGTLLEDLKAHGWKLDGVTLYQPSFDTLLMKQEFRNLMEGNIEFERLNTKAELPIYVA